MKTIREVPILHPETVRGKRSTRYWFWWSVRGTKFRGKRYRTAEERNVAMENKTRELLSRERPKITHLTEAQIKEAEAAFEMMKTQQVPGLIVAIAYYAQHYRAATAGPRLEEAAEQFKAFKKLKGVADRTYGEYQLHFNDVIKHFGKDFETGKLTTEAAATYLARWQSNLLSYSHHRRTMAALWSWLAKAKKVDGNPLLGIPNPNNNNRLAYAKKPSHYHLKEVRVLLKAAPRKLLPFLALALFSGMRTEEIARLQQDGAWEKINLRTLRIQVRGKRGPRDVLIKQPLAAWLRKFEARKPAFWTPSHWIWFRELKRSELDAKRARIPNLLRHTYCTYALNAKGASYAEVSRQAGNSEAMLKRHYEGNATQEDAATFFLITPRVAGL